MFISFYFIYVKKKWRSMGTGRLQGKEAGFLKNEGWRKWCLEKRVSEEFRRVLHGKSKEMENKEKISRKRETDWLFCRRKTENWGGFEILLERFLWGDNMFWAYCLETPRFFLVMGRERERESVCVVAEIGFSRGYVKRKWRFWKKTNNRGRRLEDEAGREEGEKKLINLLSLGR